MITIKPLEGVNLRNRQLESSAVDGIFDDNHNIGVCEKREGGNAALFEIVSESQEDEIRKALDSRDGATCDRIVLLAPRDPRRHAK